MSSARSRSGGSAIGEDAEAVVEVFAERLVADGLEQVAVGGGDDPDVDRHRRAAADALDLALLEDAEELGLGLQGQLADLVQEEASRRRPARSGRSAGRWRR